MRALLGRRMHLSKPRPCPILPTRAARLCTKDERDSGLPFCAIETSPSSRAIRSNLLPARVQLDISHKRTETENRVGRNGKSELLVRNKFTRTSRTMIVLSTSDEQQPNEKTGKQTYDDAFVTMLPRDRASGIENASAVFAVLSDSVRFHEKRHLFAISLSYRTECTTLSFRPATRAASRPHPWVHFRSRFVVERPIDRHLAATWARPAATVRHITSKLFPGNATLSSRFHYLTVEIAARALVKAVKSDLP